MTPHGSHIGCLLTAAQAVAPQYRYKISGHELGALLQNALSPQKGSGAGGPNLAPCFCSASTLLGNQPPEEPSEIQAQLESLTPDDFLCSLLALTC